MTNAGPSTATGFSIADAVPAAITGVVATCAVTGIGSCGTNGTTGNNVSFTNANLPAGAGQALTITITGTVGPGTTGNLVNTATVTAGAGQTDPATGNNSATDTDTQGAGVADLAIAKTDGQSGYVAGTPITYTLTVTNAGPSNAAPVNVSDTVPASITGVTASCTAAGTASCGTNASAGNNVAFTGASVAAGAGNSLTITISGTVDPGDHGHAGQHGAGDGAGRRTLQRPEPGQQQRDRHRRTGDAGRGPGDHEDGRPGRLRAWGGDHLHAGGDERGAIHGEGPQRQLTPCRRRSPG